tara:strand:- start:1126 stop:1425 length:300 start_codon:yes stop_codon:yes gene_type:complete
MVNSIQLKQQEELKKLKKILREAERIAREKKESGDRSEDITVTVAQNTTITSGNSDPQDAAKKITIEAPTVQVGTKDKPAAKKKSSAKKQKPTAKKKDK